MKLSIILLDWGVRESFHLLQYLKAQEQPREDYEIIWIDWGERGVHDPRLRGNVDQHIELRHNQEEIYHKHQMYNAGLLAARGEITCIMDSDAMVTPKFVGEVIKWTSPGTVFHMDEVRSRNKNLYPFRYPSFDDIKQPPSNWVAPKGCTDEQYRTKGTTRGLSTAVDPYHLRNYGACMAAPTKSLFLIAGADEHEDYRGHICGPYEMTFRLINFGHVERWHPKEFLYHAWHPGQDGIDNPKGPHDGRNMAVRAMMHLQTGRILPWAPNRLMTEKRSCLL